MVLGDGCGMEPGGRYIITHMAKPGGALRILRIEEVGG